MSNDVKKYLITALTLGLIATGSALLIAGTNAVTRDTIAQNEVKQVNKGISNIYGDGAKSVDEQEVKDSNHTYVTTQYVVNNSEDALCGYAFKTTGSNSYGKISLIVGFDNEYVYKNIFVVVNEQSFATTLNKKYLNRLIKKEIKLTDVSCGATYGAILVRDMVDDATAFVEELKGANNG